MSVNEKLVPAVGVAVAVARVSLLAGAADTIRFAVVEMALTASEAVSVCEPALIRVAVKLRCPPARVESGGSTTLADVSLLLKWTVPP